MSTVGDIGAKMITYSHTDTFKETFKPGAVKLNHSLVSEWLIEVPCSSAAQWQFA